MRNLAAALFVLIAASAAIAEEEATSAEVYQAVARLGADVDLVREAMGRPESTAAPWVVVQAKPRHLFYQGLTLLRKSNRLAAELVSTPTDVYDLATTLLAEVAYLTLVLEAKDVDAPPIERPKHVFPSHVYQLAGMLQDELARLEERQ